ncbi:DUF192 domain-containing protein [Candidatus Woesearchaeota archaeon]|jgi:uncharacterized protein|nr:DUF192 domain-containing protein [Candidatus Woesearchaeota archaeon]
MLFEKDSKQIICKKVRLRISLVSKMIGLMFSNRAQIEDTAHIFIFTKPIFLSLHMWFVFYPIDVLFIDSNKKIVDIKQNFLPFTFYTAQKKAKFFIEVKKGLIKKKNLLIGSSVEWT